MKLNKDLHEFIASLNSTDAKYVIVGGYAVAFHGHPRYTGDIDIFIEQSPNNARRISKAVDIFGFSILGLKPEDFNQPDAVIQLGYPPNRIDIITSISGANFDQVWSSRVIAELDDLPVSFISRPLLIQNKLATARPKDLADIEQLRPRQPE